MKQPETEMAAETVRGLHRDHLLTEESSRKQESIMSAKHRILLVDDHPPLIMGTKLMLEQEEDFEVTAAGPEDNVEELVLADHFDVMLFDLQMPGLSGIELSRRVLKRKPDATVLIYTGYDITPHFHRLVEIGVTGFVSKTLSRERLVQAIRHALNRETVIPVALLRMLCKGERNAGPGHDGGPVMLTDREMEILKEVAKGKSNKMISESMHMSQRSVEYALTQVFHKLSAHCRVEAVNKARALGLLLDGDLGQDG